MSVQWPSFLPLPENPPQAIVATGPEPPTQEAKEAMKAEARARKKRNTSNKLRRAHWARKKARVQLEISRVKQAKARRANATAALEKQLRAIHSGEVRVPE